MNRIFAALMLGVSLLGCPADDALDTDDTDWIDDTDTPIDTADTAAPRDNGDPGPLGFIGSPCTTSADCSFAGSVCLTDGYDGGTCSQACDQFCPDADGHPTTFCVTDADLDGQAAALGDGACHARCDFGQFPVYGCRTGYACVATARANDPSTRTYSCLPGTRSDLSACYFDLAERGIGFEPTIRDADSAAGASEPCVIEDPLYITSPMLGVDLKYFDGSATPRVLGACEMAHALADTIEDVAPLGVDAIRHIGTYNCRVIAGTSTLSQHSFGDAIDFYGFEFSDGRYYTLIDDWEHATPSPSTEGGRFLYDAAYRWYEDRLWHIILTPNYNSAHDNHFHVDLTPFGDFIGATDGYVLTPHDGDCGGPPMRDRYLP